MIRFGGGWAAAAIVAAVIAAGVPLGVGLLARAQREGAPPAAQEATKPGTAVGSTGPGERAPTLYCEFNNFADLTPLVGFYFRIEALPAPAYALIFRREQDGTQADPVTPDAPPARWTFDGSEDPAVIRAPDHETAINLYSYEPAKPGTTWFEAGLRSVRYRNLGGRCRRSA